ncbi:MAG: LysM peptidoglycan-binding domain-containing protein [Flavobacteriales bacterium]|nr:LysM peptidoglycan-binding domain-containing protein [Flavobacteriales bacterium]
MREGIKYYLLLIVICFITIQTSSAQTDLDSLEIHNIKGKEYYIHIIQKGESLYFMHKKYNVPLELIRKENPSVADGLSIGEKIFIPVKKNVEFEVKTNGNFINHTVKKGQTLYAISKMYKISQKEIIAVNQKEIAEGIGEGAILKIPVKSIKEEGPPKNSLEGQKYKTHIVKKGETLYSLSKYYKTSVDSIKSVNGGLKQGLKRGEVIYIPSEKVITVKIPDNDTLISGATILDTLEQLFTDTGLVVKKITYKIALMLPFYLDENDAMTERRNALEKKSIYSKSKFAIEFYNGFKMALDSISTDSNKFKIYVYDTKGNDSLRIKNLLLKPEIKEVDLIVGPLYYNNFKYVTEFAKAHEIPIISPVKQNNKLLLGNQYVFKAIPSKSTTIKQIATLVVDSFKNENLLAIEYENSKEKMLVELYVKAYNNQILNSKDTIIYSSIKTLKINTRISDIVSHLKLNKNNVIFVPTSNQTFVTNLFSYLSTVLNKRDYKNCQITLIGLEEWVGYENIDLEYFQKLNVHYCSTRFINDKDSLTNNFIRNYVTQKATYPSKNTFLGFDIAYFAGSNFIQEGTLFSTLALQKYKGMSINLNFFKTGIESGFENTNSYLLKFDDFTLKRVY